MTPREGSHDSLEPTRQRRGRRLRLRLLAGMVVVLPLIVTLGYHWQPVVNWRIEREARAHLAAWESGDRSRPMRGVQDGALARTYELRADGARLDFVIDVSPYGDHHTVRAVESDAAVVLLVIHTDGPDGAVPANAVRREMTVTLARPLGSRVVLDPTSGERLRVAEPVR